MGWETRGGSKRYYTRSRRVNGRVVREYFGRGEKAEQAAREDHQQRLDRQFRKKKLAMEAARWETMLQAAEEYHNAVEIVARAILLCEGYHNHRGQWRKRRQPDNQQPAATQGASPDAAPAETPQRANDAAPSEPQIVASGDRPLDDREAGADRGPASAADQVARRRPVPQRSAFEFQGGFRRGPLTPQDRPGPTQPATVPAAKGPRPATIGTGQAGQLQGKSDAGDHSADRRSPHRPARGAASVSSGAGPRPPPAAGPPASRQAAATLPMTRSSHAQMTAPRKKSAPNSLNEGHQGSKWTVPAE